MSNNPAIYEVISKKYLRSILDISVLLLLLPLPLPLLLLLLCDIKWKHFVRLAPYHVALERFLPVLTKTVKDAEYHDLIVHGLTCHPFIWRESKHVTLYTLCLPYTCTSRTYTLRRDWVWVIRTLSFPSFQCKKNVLAQVIIQAAMVCNGWKEWRTVQRHARMSFVRWFIW